MLQRTRQTLSKATTRGKHGSCFIWHSTCSLAGCNRSTSWGILVLHKKEMVIYESEIPVRNAIRVTSYGGILLFLLARGNWSSNVAQKRVSFESRIKEEWVLELLQI